MDSACSDVIEEYGGVLRHKRGPQPAVANNRILLPSLDLLLSYSHYSGSYLPKKRYELCPMMTYILSDGYTTKTEQLRNHGLQILHLRHGKNQLKRNRPQLRKYLSPNISS